MSSHHYSINMQSLLFLVKELHERGYENLRVEPFFSPSGMSWRCLYISGQHEVNASSWLADIININLKPSLTRQQLADLFETQHQDFLQLCTAKNKDYTQWYKGMLLQLEKGELPYAYGEYFPAGDHWRTTRNKTIATLPEEWKYYIHY